MLRDTHDWYREVVLELDDQHAMALAQFVKRVSWSDLRGWAVNDDEGWLMKSAIDKLQHALCEEGYSPR